MTHLLGAAKGAVGARVEPTWRALGPSLRLVGHATGVGSLAAAVPERVRANFHGDLVHAVCTGVFVGVIGNYYLIVARLAWVAAAFVAAPFPNPGSTDLV